MMSDFHQMEIKYKLFEIGSERSFPVWDILRSHIYNYCLHEEQETYVTTVKDRFLRVKRISLILFVSLLNCFRLPFNRGRVVIYENPCDLNNEGYYYDHISKQLIESIPPHQRLVINNSRFRPTLFKDINIELLTRLYSLIAPKSNMPFEEFKTIKKALKDTFEYEPSYDELNRIYKEKRQLSSFFSAFFRFMKPLKVVSSLDQQKPIYHAAKKLGIETFEMQHAGLIFEYPSYSYPQFVSPDDNIAFADNYLQFGPAWSRINNIPSKRIVIGNDYFVHQCDKREIEDDYVLFISSIECASHLIPFAKALAKQLPKVKFIYKLHRKEFTFKAEYEGKLEECGNVDVVTNEYELQGLITFCKMGVLVYSSVGFELANKGKKIAILKADNYYLMANALINVANIKCVQTVEDALSLYYERELTCERNEPFYCGFKTSAIKELFNL